MTIIQALRRLRGEDYQKLEASLGYIRRPFLKQQRSIVSEPVQTLSITGSVIMFTQYLRCTEYDMKS